MSEPKVGVYFALIEELELLLLCELLQLLAPAKGCLALTASRCLNYLVISLVVSELLLLDWLKLVLGLALRDVSAPLRWGESLDGVKEKCIGPKLSFLDKGFLKSTCLETLGAAFGEIT